MYNLINVVKDKTQRFTRSEIQAEILRQQIQELEARGAANDNDLSADSQKLERLKLELAEVEEPAQLQAQGRVLIRKQLEIMEQFGESKGEVPSDACHTFEETRKWIEAVDDERRRRYLRHMSYFRQHWPVAGWEHRLRMLQWLGRHSLWRFTSEKPRYHIGRVVMGWAPKLVKKL